MIARRTLELCDAGAVTVAEYDGAVLDYRAMVGIEPEREARMRAAFPRPPGREFVPGRVVLTGEMVIIPDVQADMELFAPARGMGGRTAIGLPIFSGGRVIGVISPLWFEVRPINSDEIALQQSFAEQAAIAIASAKAQRALQARTSDLEESLAYQTATSDILKVISQSAFVLQPVLEAVAEMSVRLCEADQCTLWLIDGEAIRYGAHYPVQEGGRERRERLTGRRLDIDSHTALSRAAIERRVVQIEDVLTVPGYVSAGLVEGQAHHPRRAHAARRRRAGRTVAVAPARAGVWRATD